MTSPNGFGNWPPPTSRLPTRNSSKSNVVNFTIDEDGQVALAPEPLPNGLQSDQDSRDNHAELRRLLQNGLDASQPGLTQATDVANSAEPCLDALGLSVEEVKPRLLVLRGRELVRQIESRLNEFSMLPPLSQAQQDAFLPWKDAFEMFVALDPRLSSLWNARFDAADETLTTGQVRLIADAIRELGVARDEAVEIVESSVAGVEPGADEADPARRTASEIAKNVFRAMGRAYRGVENAIKTSERVVKLVEKVAHLHAKISPHLPEGDAIRRILDWTWTLNPSPSMGKDAKACSRESGC